MAPSDPQRLSPQARWLQGLGVATGLLVAAAPRTSSAAAARAPAGKPTGPAAAPTSIAINKPGRLEPGSRQQLVAMGILPDGSLRDVTAEVSWGSSDEAIVRFLGGGMAEVGPGSGPVTITAAARSGKPRDTVTVKVQARLQDIVVTPANPLLLKVGDIELLTASAVYADGSTEDVTASVDWACDREDVADFTGPG